MALQSTIGCGKLQKFTPIQFPAPVRHDPALPLVASQQIR
jgi:hypothetical protein